MKKFALVGLLSVGILCWVGPGVYAAHSDYGCNNCHVPHQAVAPTATEYGVPLWSPNETSDGLKYTYTMYSGTQKFKSLVIDTGKQSAQPDGPSRLCLGCHDGSYPKIAQVGGGFEFLAGDLARSHPISIIYDSAMAQASGGTLNDPTTTLSGEPGTSGTTIDHDLLDTEHKVQCTSCHDVHASAAQPDYALRYPMTVTPVTNPDGTTTFTLQGDQVLCKVCHNK